MGWGSAHASSGALAMGLLPWAQSYECSLLVQSFPYCLMSNFGVLSSVAGLDLEQSINSYGYTFWRGFGDVTICNVVNLYVRLCLFLGHPSDITSVATGERIRYPGIK